MQPGFVAVSQGLLWMRNAEGSTLDFAENIPGTNAVMRANRLPAWRCPACELLTMRYGREVYKHMPTQHYTPPPTPTRDDENEDDANAPNNRR